MTKLSTAVATKMPGADNMMRQIDHRSRDSFPFAREVAKPQGGLDAMLDWCRSELCNDWRWQLVEMSSNRQSGRYIFYFDSDRDAVAFAMKWC